MKSIIFLWLCTCLRNVCHVEGNQDALQEVSQSNWEFTRSFYTEMSNATTTSASMLFSPLSVQMVLAMCYLGAGGETAKQMSKGLRLPGNRESVKSGFKQLLTSLPSASGSVTFEAANTIFPSTKFSVLKPFTNTVRKFFLSGVENVDYKNPEKAANTINRWVKKKTHAKITDIVNPGGLDPATKMLLVNAVYFKGAWAIGFKIKQTSKAPFFVNGKDKKQMVTMHQRDLFRCQEYDNIGAKLLELPYKDKSTVLVIVLPVALDGLPSVEAKLHKVDFMEFLETSEFKDVELSLPRFSLKQSTSLDSVLGELGMVGMFGHDADFSKMTSQSGISVSKVLHKARLDVNEEGTVAAAVTAGIDYSDALAMPRDHVEFIANHPFLFALISKKARVVLFMGRYTGTKTTNAPVLKSAAGLQHYKHVSSAASSLGANSFLWWMFLTVFSLRVSSLLGLAALDD